MSKFQNPAVDKVSTYNKLSFGHWETVQLMSKMIFIHILYTFEESLQLPQILRYFDETWYLGLKRAVLPSHKNSKW